VKETKALQNLKTELQEGIQAISVRQKWIKVADWSNYGWVTVEEYINDELASDSEDEKCLFKTERNAERKALKRKRHPTKTKEASGPS